MEYSLPSDNVYLTNVFDLHHRDYIYMISIFKDGRRIIYVITSDLRFIEIGSIQCQEIYCSLDGYVIATIKKESGTLLKRYYIDNDTLKKEDTVSIRDKVVTIEFYNGQIFEYTVYNKLGYSSVLIDLETGEQENWDARKRNRYDPCITYSKSTYYDHDKKIISIVGTHVRFLSKDYSLFRDDSKYYIFNIRTKEMISTVKYSYYEPNTNTLAYIKKVKESFRRTEGEFVHKGEKTTRETIDLGFIYSKVYPWKEIDFPEINISNGVSLLFTADVGYFDFLKERRQDFSGYNKFYVFS